MCCLAGHQPVCVDSGSAAAGALSMSLLVIERTEAEASCLCWVCVALWEECSIVRRTFLVQDLTRHDRGEGGKCLQTKLRFSTTHMTEEHTFTPHPDLRFLQRDQSSHHQARRLLFLLSHHSESLGLGEPGVTLEPQSAGLGRLCASMVGDLFYLP